jgi:hypothetical protein
MSKVAARETTRIAVEIGNALPKGIDARRSAERARTDVEALVRRARAVLDAHEA